jgi:ribosomal protein S18 acetylase RimI-like enzyme
VSAITIRPTTLADAPAVLSLHLAAASRGGGLAREPDEMSLEPIEAVLAKALATGVALSAWSDGAIAGEIHAGRLGPRQFNNSLTELTVAVHPDFQGRGIGGLLFEALFAEARKLPGVTRVELFCREGNRHALRLYERLGFVIEGRLVRRVVLADGTVEDDLTMAKFL